VTPWYGAAEVFEIDITNLGGGTTTDTTHDRERLFIMVAFFWIDLESIFGICHSDSV